MGLLERVHGGAILKKQRQQHVPVERRKLQHLAEKQRTWTLAALEYIEDGDTLILDGGTTTIELARLLGDKNLLVVVSDLSISRWNSCTNPISICSWPAGGCAAKGAFTLVGRDTERMLEKYLVKRSFGNQCVRP